MTQKVTNLGVTVGCPFCMAYLFTAGGTKIVAGSMDRITYETRVIPICHGMVHYYQRVGMEKQWLLFGGRVNMEFPARFRLEHIKSGPGGWVPHWFHKKPKRAVWAIYNVPERKVVGTWRRLPSCFLKQLGKYQEYQPRAGCQLAGPAQAAACQGTTGARGVRRLKGGLE